jgi:hypothetical protein
MRAGKNVNFIVNFTFNKSTLKFRFEGYFIKIVLKNQG